jgi:hypothetical protein
VRLLVLQHLGHAELAVLGVAQLRPQRAAALGQPGVEFGERAEAPLAASIQMRRRLSCTFFSTTPFSQPEATLQKSGRTGSGAHHREAR